MKKRVLATLLATTMACTIGVTIAFATAVKEDTKPVDVVESVEIMPHDLVIDRGNISNNTGLKTSGKLNKSNGTYVNLYVENKGSNDVVATINHQSERTFKPGEKGYIYVEVTQGFLDADKNYAFNVVPGTNGGSVQIFYAIAQRDYP